MSEVSFHALSVGSEFSLSTGRTTTERPATDLGELMYLDKNILKLDHSYQRPIKSWWVSRIIRGFNPLQVNVLKVSRRPTGEMFIIDGQHTHAAAMRIPTVSKLPCQVFDIDTIEKEARLFISINKDRKDPSPLETYTADLCAKDSEAMKINAMMNHHGLNFGTNSKGPSGTKIRCVEFVLVSHEKNADALNKSLKFCLFVLDREFEIHRAFLVGVFYLMRIPSVANQMLSRPILERCLDRVKAKGANKLMTKIKQAVAEGGGGIDGGRLQASGILQFFNAGRSDQYKIKLSGDVA